MGGKLRARLGWLANRAYARFFAWYALVLLLPLIVFSIVYNSYFLRTVRQDVLDRSVSALSQQAQTLDSYLRQMDAIGGQTSSLLHMRGVNLRHTSVFSEVRNTLAGFNNTHLFFDRVMYYSTAMPQMIFSDSGTYNVRYFARYRRNGADLSLPEALAGVSRPAWVLPGDVDWKLEEGGAPTLQYILPVASDYPAHLIFFVPERTIAGALQTQDAATYLMHGAVTLYPFHADAGGLSLPEGFTAPGGEAEILPHGDAFLLRVPVGTSGLSCVRVISQSRVLQKVTETQRVFVTVLVSLAVIGGMFVFWVSFHNYRPIHILGEIGRGKVDVPRGLHGIDRARYAMEKLDERYVLLDQKRRREQTILRLTLGTGKRAEGLEAEMAGLGLAFESPYLRVAMLSYTAVPDSAALLGELGALCGVMHGEPEWILLEYPHPGHYLLVFGMQEDDGRLLRDRILTQIASTWHGPVREGVRMAVGGGCRSIGHLHQSYLQAVLAEQMEDSLFERGVLIYDNIPAAETGFQYPRKELDTLYEALLDADIDKARLITEILTDIIHGQRANNFIYTSLCYDTLSTYARAQEELRLQGQGNLPEGLNYELLCDLPDLESMMNLIFDVRDKTATAMSMGQRGGARADIARKAMDYIDKHYKEESLCASRVADHFGMSISNLSHQFKAQSGITLSDYISRRKLAYARELLAVPENRVSDVSAMLGYNQPTSFIRKFKQYYGVTPNEYRSGEA